MHLDSNETTQSFMMKTGNGVLTDFTRFASFHRNGALKSRGLQTYACTDGEPKRLHIFTSASSFKSSPAFLNSHFVRATRITNTVVKQNHIRCWLYRIPTQTVQHFINWLSEQQSSTTTSLLCYSLEPTVGLKHLWKSSFGSWVLDLYYL